MKTPQYLIGLIAAACGLVCIVGCASYNPYFDNNRLVGVLNNNGIGPADGAFILSRSDGSVALMALEQPENLWPLFERACSISSWKGAEFITVRLNGAGSSATMRVNPDDSVALKLLEKGDNVELPRHFDGLYYIPGIYRTLAAGQSDTHRPRQCAH